MSDMIYTGMHIPTSCSMCWVRGTCEVWAMELHKQRGHGKRLDNCPLRPLVRCKDCRNWSEMQNSTGACLRNSVIDGSWWTGTDATDFCSFGERKDHE